MENKNITLVTGLDDSGSDDNLDTLRAYSLVIATAESNMCEMHQLVHFCMRVWLSSFSDVEGWRRKFLMLMSRELPTVEFETGRSAGSYFRMLNRYFGHEPADEESLRDWARVLSNGAWYIWTEKRYKAAENTVMKATSARGRTSGREHPDTHQGLSGARVVEPRPLGWK